LWGVELARDPATRTPFPPDLRLGKRIGAEAQARGLILRHDPEWFALAPPLIVDQSELDVMLAILDESIGAVLARL
jgi:adenosylmethionine-8-amino-7-oxononanoate aminotransferase